MASYEIGKLVWQITGDTSGIDQSLKKTETGLSKLGGVVKGFLGLGLVTGFASIAKASLSASAAMEKNKIAFTTMLGSADKANKLMQDMSRFAASTPFELPQIVNAGKQLLAFGVESENIIPTLTRLGDVAAALNIPIGELSDLYGKARVQGTLYAEDLNQLAGRGIPIFTELAKVMGVNANQVKKLGSEGKITFDKMEQAFVNMTKDGSQFGGLMSAQSRSLSGQWSNLNDALGRTAVLLGNNMMTSAKNLVGVMSNLLGIANGLIEKYNIMTQTQKHQVGYLELYNNGLNGTGEKLAAILKYEKDKAGYALLYNQYLKGETKLSDIQLEKLQDILQLNRSIEEITSGKGGTSGGTKPKKDPVVPTGGKGESEATKLRRETFEKNTMYDKLESEKLQIELDNRIGLYQKYKLNSKKDVDDLAEYKKNAEKEITKAQEKELRERLEKYNAYSQAIGGSITNLLSAFQSYFNARGQADIEALDAQMQAELEAAGVAEETQAEQAQREYDAAVATGDALAIEEKRRALVKAQIEEKYQKKKRQLEYETALTAWKLQVGMSLIQSFQAPLNAYVSALAIPVIGNFVAPGLAAAAGVAAGAMFAATLESKPQPPKYASGGIIPGSAQGTQIIAGDGGTELVSNADQMANILNAIGNGASTGGGYRQVPPMSRDDLFTMIFEASQNGDLFVAERALVKR